MSYTVPNTNEPMSTENLPLPVVPVVPVDPVVEGKKPETRTGQQGFFPNCTTQSYSRRDNDNPPPPPAAGAAGLAC